MQVTTLSALSTILTLLGYKIESNIVQLNENDYKYFKYFKFKILTKRCVKDVTYKFLFSFISLKPGDICNISCLMEGPM